MFVAYPSESIISSLCPPIQPASPSRRYGRLEWLSATPPKDLPLESCGKTSVK